MKEDRSSQKTRKAIRQALMRLLKNKRLDQITVKNITEEANYCRNTFYTHYRDVYDVVEDIANRYAEAFTDSGKKLTLYSMQQQPLKCAQEVMDCIEESPYIYEFAFGKQHTPFFDMFRQRMCTENIQRFKQENPNVDGAIAAIAIPCAVSVFLEGFREWYNKSKSVDELARVIKLMGTFIGQGIISCTGISPSIQQDVVA